MKLGWRVMVTVIVLTAIFLILPWRDVLSSMGRMRWEVWLAIVAGFLAGHALGVVKWRLIVNAGRAGLRGRDAVGCYAAGLFANLCLPSIVGGDVLRAVLAGRRTQRPEAVVLGGVADRLSDVLALAVLIAFGGLAAGRTVPGMWRLVLTVVVVSGVAVGAIVVFLVVTRPLRSWPPRLRRILARTLVAARQLVRRPATAMTAFALSLVIQSGFVLLNAGIGATIGISQPVSVWFLAWPIAKLSGLIPISLGGLAVREATLATMLVPFGVAPSLGVAASLVWQTVLIAGGLVSGGIWLAFRQNGGLVVPRRGTAAVAKAGHV